LGNYTDISGFGVGTAKFNGRLDDTRISKVARSDAEILASSQRAAPLVVSATVTLTNTTQTYDGSAKAVTVTTVPANLSVSVTYDGSTTIPAAAGTYAVVATVTAANYSGSASGTLTITQGTPVIILANPTAVLDVPATVNYGQSFTLTGSRSSAVGGTIVSYIWTALDSDTNLHINTPVTTTASTIDIVAPFTNLIIGTHRFQLQVVDSSGTISDPDIATITVVDSTVVDTTAPDTTFFVSVTDPTLTIDVTFAASDAFGVTGYLLKDTAVPPLPTDPGWTSTPPTSYSYRTWGNNVLHAYAKDAAGNISAPKLTVILIGPTDGIIVPAAQKLEPTLEDALKSLNFAMKVMTPTPEEFTGANVSPLVNGIPQPPASKKSINLGDTIVTLRRVIGL
jgi:hypothetical protein